MKKIILFLLIFSALNVSGKIKPNLLDLSAGYQISSPVKEDITNLYSSNNGLILNASIRPANIFSIGGFYETLLGVCGPEGQTFPNSKMESLGGEIKLFFSSDFSFFMRKGKLNLKDFLEKSSSHKGNQIAFGIKLETNKSKSLGLFFECGYKIIEISELNYNLDQIGISFGISFNK